MQYILLRHFWAVKRNLRSYTQTKKHLRDLPIAGDIFVVNQSGKEKPLGNNVHITHNLWVLFHETINWDKSNSHYERKQRSSYSLHIELNLNFGIVRSVAHGGQGPFIPNSHSFVRRSSFEKFVSSLIRV